MTRLIRIELLKLRTVRAGVLAGHAAGAVLGAALLAAAGVGIGSLIRSQLAGIIGIFVWGW